MRRGCISLGGINCDICNRVIQYPERYLCVDEEDGKEVEKGETVRYCVKCALDKGYAHYKVEKGEKILSFFTESDFNQE
ncbi:MAG: hypothetical protein WC958_02465 [Dehalococcoidales bacterium]